MWILNLLWLIWKDNSGGTLSITRKTANTLITASGFNVNYDEIEAVLNGGIDGDNLEDDAVTAAKLNADVVRTDYGLSQHTTGALQIDLSDTTPSLEITDGGLRAKVDGSSIERAAGGLQVKAGGVTNAMLAGSIDLTSKVTGVLPNSNLATITTAGKVNTSALTGTTYLPDGTVDTTALKTAMGEVSTITAAYLILPGGEYGFCPQVKASTAAGNAMAYVGMVASWGTSPTSYATIISMYGEGGQTVFAQQRYVTASGIDLWIFLLIDKTTKDILTGYQATDHPAYGNGGDFNKVPHPFTNYNPKLHEVILVDKTTVNLLRSQMTGKRSLLTVINEDMRVDYETERFYEPLHSGKFLEVNKNGGQEMVMEMVMEIAPYIKVRALKPLK